MSSAKKLLMTTAAGGADALNVEDVFSIYNYEGDNTSRSIKNGINLGTNIVDTATNFNGGSYLYKNGFTMSRSKEITFSVWFQPIANPVTSFSLVAVESFYFNVYGNKDQLLFVGRNTSNSNIVYAEITSSNMFQPNNWYNIQISFDLTNSSNRHVYLNGTELSMTWSTYLNQEIDTLRSHTYIGTRSGSDYLYQSNMAHFFLDTNYIDLSVQSNRELFYPASNTFPNKNIIHSLGGRIYLPMTKSFAVGGNIGTYNNSTDFTASSSGITLTDVTLDTAAEADGGLVWIKARDQYQGSTVEHALFDTERGIYKPLASNSTAAESTSSYGINAYNTDGWSFNVGFSGRWNGIHSGVGTNYCSWTFRKAPKFFDIVTYTGNGTAGRTISHNLGSAPGCIIVKGTSSAGNWWVYHKDGQGAGSAGLGVLNSSAAFYGDSINDNYFGNGTSVVAPTSTVFTVGADDTNINGKVYVAYLFAHNDGDGEFGPTGDQDIIKCGSVSYNAGATVNLGFEPQWVLVKPTDSTGNWIINDNLRGMPATSRGLRLDADNDGSDISNAAVIFPTATGFEMPTTVYNPTNLIYIAIRRGPMAIAENSIDVFDIFEPLQNDTELPTNPKFKSEFKTVDFGLQRLSIGSSGNTTVFDRLRGSTKGLETNSDDTESAASTSLSGLKLDYNYGYQPTSSSVGHFYDFAWMWSRAPHFFDAVHYTGNGSAGRTIDHNLGVAPEMMWVKSRTSYDDWYVYHSATGNTQYMILNTYVTNATTDSTMWNNTTPSASSFTLGSNSGVNGSGNDYMAYLFASLDGVSKVGTYAGSSSTQNIDCGFSNGAKLVLIHRISAASLSGAWYLFDSERGIYDTTFAAGYDQYLRINQNAAQTTNQDYLEPYSAGFGVNTNTDYINASGYNYVYYAIANPY